MSTETQVASPKMDADKEIVRKWKRAKHQKNLNGSVQADNNVRGRSSLQEKRK